MHEINRDLKYGKVFQSEKYKIEENFFISSTLHDFSVCIMGNNISLIINVMLARIA